MPVAITTRLNSEMNRALDRADVKAGFTSQSLESIGGSSEQFSALIKDELAKWRKVVKEAGMRID